VSRGRVTAVILVLGVVVVIVAVLLRPDSTTGPYRLGDSSPRGWSGLARVMERLGVPTTEVGLDEVDGRSPGDRVVVVPRASFLGDREAERIRSLAREGALVVLGGPPDRPTPPLSQFRPIVQYQSPRTCTQPDLAAVAGLDRIDTADLEPLPVPAGATSCYGNGSQAFVVDEPVGAGHVVTLAGPDLWANDVMRTLDQPSDEAQGPMADNVVMAAALLSSGGPGGIDVVTKGLGGAPVAAGEGGLFSHVPTGIKLGIWQGCAALAVFALVRARRWGRVVDEPLPVTIAGSELVEARAGLMERRRDPGHAAAVIRRDAVRRLGEELGLGRQADPATVAATLAQRTGADPARVVRLLAGPPPPADADLIRLIDDLDRLQEDLHDDALRHPT